MASIICVFPIGHRYRCRESTCKECLRIIYSTEPQIKGLVATNDSSAYVVQEITEEVTTDNGQTTEGNTDTTEDTDDAKKADIQVETVFENSITKLQGKELTLVIFLLILVNITLVGAALVIIMTIQPKKKRRD